MKKAALFISLLLAIISAVSCSKSGNIIVPDDPQDTDTAIVTDVADTEGEEEIEILDPTEGTAFKKGKIEGNVYTSEFSGIKFTLPDVINFMTQEELDKMAEQSLKMANPEDRMRLMSKITEAEVFDIRTSTLLDISYYNLNILGPENMGKSEEEFFREFIMPMADNMGVTVTEPVEVVLGGRTFTMLKMGEEKKTAPAEYLYVSRIDNDFIIFITACPGIIGGQEEFEACFEALS